MLPKGCGAKLRPHGLLLLLLLLLLPLGRRPAKVLPKGRSAKLLPHGLLLLLLQQQQRLLRLLPLGRHWRPAILLPWSRSA